MKIKEKYWNIVGLLKQIHASYKQCLGDKSLCLLNCYLEGFIKAIHFNNNFENQEAKHFEENENGDKYYGYIGIADFLSLFQKKIELKYKCKLSKSWYNILRFISDSEEEAFELFYNEIDIFCEDETPVDSFIENKNYDQGKYGEVRILGKEKKENIFEMKQYKSPFYQELWEMLSMIRNAPNLVIGEKSLVLINAYISGFSYAYHLFDKNGSIYGIFPGFEEWVNQRAGLNVYRPWYKVIIFQCTNEESAFNLFYKYLQEYVEEIS